MIYPVTDKVFFKRLKRRLLFDYHYREGLPRKGLTNDDDQNYQEYRERYNEHADDFKQKVHYKVNRKKRHRVIR